MGYPKVLKNKGGSTAMIMGEVPTGRKPLIGAYYDGVNEWIPCSWTGQGLYDTEGNERTHLDLDAKYLKAS